MHLSPDIDLKASQAFTLEKDAAGIDWLLRCAESPSGQSRKKKNLKWLLSEAGGCDMMT